MRVAVIIMERIWTEVRMTVTRKGFLLPAYWTVIVSTRSTRGMIKTSD